MKLTLPIPTGKEVIVVTAWLLTLILLIATTKNAIWWTSNVTGLTPEQGEGVFKLIGAGVSFGVCIGWMADSLAGALKKWLDK